MLRISSILKIQQRHSLTFIYFPTPLYTKARLQRWAFVFVCVKNAAHAAA